MPVAEDSVTLDLLAAPRHPLDARPWDSAASLPPWSGEGPVTRSAFARSRRRAVQYLVLPRRRSGAGNHWRALLCGLQGLLILRILLIGLGTFAILRTSEIVVPALLLGLLASAAAVFLEILYLLIFYART